MDKNELPDPEQLPLSVLIVDDDPQFAEAMAETLSGMLERVSMNGNIVSDTAGERYHHTHAVFSFRADGQHRMAGGHMKSITVLYTAEIELRPVLGGTIMRKRDEETGTGFWDFSERE